MDADPAAGAGVTAATASTAEAETDLTEEPGLEARALEEEGIPAEVREMLQPKGTDERDETDETRAASERDAAAGRQKDSPGAGKKAGGEEDGEDEEPVSDEHKAQWPTEALGRIHKLSAKAKDRLTRAVKAEAKAEELAGKLTAAETELKNASPFQLTPSEQSPLGHVMDEQTLGEAVAFHKERLKRAALSPNGAVDFEVGKDPKTGEPILEDLTAEQMAKMKFEDEEMLREHIPARQRYIGARRQNDELARQLYPQMFNAGTPENTLYQEFRKMMPELERFVDPDLTVARYLRGLQAEFNEAEVAAKAAAARNGGKKPSEQLKPFLQPKPKIAPPVAEPRGGIPGAGAEQRNEKQAEAKLVESGGDESAVEAYVDSLVNRRTSDREALV